MNYHEITLEEALKILKDSVFCNHPKEIWDQDLWLYGKLLLALNFSTTSRLKGITKSYTLDGIGQGVELLCVHWNVLYIQVYVITHQYELVATYIKKMIMLYQLPIRLTTIYPKVAQRLGEILGECVSKDFIRFYLYDSNVKLQHSEIITKYLVHKPINIFRAELDFLEMNMNTLSNTEDIFGTYKSELVQIQQSYPLLTWSVFSDDKIQLEILKKLGFKELYTEYYLDLNTIINHYVSN